MKRSAFLVLACCFLFGCGQLARESEFWDHSSMYQDWGHFCFSTVGYDNCDSKDALNSKRNGWWGIVKPCGSEAVPAPLIQNQKSNAPLIQDQKSSDPLKETVVAPAEKKDGKETPVKKKKTKAAKKKKKSKSKKSKKNTPQ